VRENLESGGFGLKGGETTLKAIDCEKKEEYFHPRTVLQKRNSHVKLNFMKRKNARVIDMEKKPVNGSSHWQRGKTSPLLIVLLSFASLSISCSSSSSPVGTRTRVRATRQLTILFFISRMHCKVHVEIKKSYLS